MVKNPMAQCCLLAILLVIKTQSTNASVTESTAPSTTSMPLIPVGPCSGGTGLLTGPEGQIGRRRTSINSDMTCRWKIEVDKGKRVGLHFSSIQIRECSPCSCGKLNIYDGSNASALMIQSLCGYYSHDDITSSGNTVFLYYEAYSSWGSAGFTIQYYTTDGACSNGTAVLTEAQGEFGSNYANDESCQWRIQVDEDQRVRLDFVSFTLPECSGCRCDKVNIHDGRNATAPLIHSLCGSDLPGNVTSSGNELFLHFESDGSDRTRGFRIRYTAIGACDGGVHILRGPSGQISSKGTSYKDYERCRWRIEVDTGEHVRLHFATFRTENCCDHVYIYDGRDATAPLIRTLHGSVLPDNITSSGNNIFVYFVTDSSFRQTGFTIQYSALGDYDVCASQPCLNGGSCHKEVNAFSCSCLADLYTGPVCESHIRYSYYQYGSSQGDANIYDTDVKCDSTGKACASEFIQIPNVQIFNGQYRRLKIYTNGYVTFGMTFDSRYPNQLSKGLLGVTKQNTARKLGFAMLTPLWTDNDARAGKVFYHIYDLMKPGSTTADKARVKHAIYHANDNVIANGGVSVTDVTWVMVITWSHMIPRMYYSSFQDQPNTFQLVIAYDPSRYKTYITYVYLEMGWDNEYTRRRSMIGYLSQKYTEEKTLQLAPSMKSTAFRLHTRLGNTGETGKYVFRISPDRKIVNYEQKCYNWFAGEMKREWLLQFYWSWTLVCPCDRRLALMDKRWRMYSKQLNERSSDRDCFYESMPSAQSTQECCYSSSGSLINTEDGRGGHTSFYNHRWWNLHMKYDVLPKRWCCKLTDNCDYFYRVRPMDHCSGYTPLSIGWFYGDPHIRTLDGFQYTFNGLGEYTLIETTHGNFTLQGRTTKARDDNGTETDATVFTAFVAKDVISDKVHIEMTNKRDGLAVFVENEDVTEWLTSANVTDFKEYGGVSLTKTNTTQVEVTYTSGFSLTIGVNAEQLDITVGAPSTFKGNTKGLMGVFNDDPTDDLLPPGSNAVALSNSSSEKTIFKEFGERWRIEEFDSLFYYAPGESYSTYAYTEFTPRFLEDVLADMTLSQRETARNTCGDNKECLFDFAITGNEDAAEATLLTNSKNEENAEILSNASPNITVEVVFNVTARKVNTLTLTTVDPDGDTVNVTLTSTLPDGATFENNLYTWTPTSMEPANISFLAADGKGGVASADVSVNLCNCSGHGQCLFDLLADGYELKQTFRIVQCNCSTGWEGDYCESDLDGCQDNPCTEGTNCTDLSPSEHIASGKAFQCSECPTGTEESEGICLPINECDPANPRNDCEHICVDQIDGYTCVCRDGYGLLNNKNNCTDIDECIEHTSGCEQVCVNSVGSFQCSCNDGYALATDNASCVIGDSLEQECNKLSCAYGCRKNGSNYVCFCQSGYDLSPDARACQDFDECSEKNGGCAHVCSNFVGGFNCNCNDGFRLMNDKKDCKLCPSGTWGKDCQGDCSCRDSNTECNETTGCAECPDGYTGGDCHEDIDECLTSNPCDKHANCSNTIGTFKCICVAGFTQFNATVCQDQDECESDPCANGGACENRENAYSCTCLAGYNGTNCETDIDECEGVPCENNGTCKDLVGKYRCVCARGFTGRNCESDMCGSSPCKNGGTCTQRLGQYECRCVTGSTGLNCETDIDECASNPCLNGGTCVNRLDGFTCQCTDGFTGPICNNDIDECASNPCLNGGTCVDRLDGFTCQCFPWLSVTVGSILGMALLVVVACIVRYVVRKRRPLPQSVTNVNYSPTMTRREMFWKKGLPTMETAPTAPNASRQVNGRKHVTSLDVNAVRSVTQRSGGSYGVSHRPQTARPSHRDEWSWTQAM